MSPSKALLEAALMEAIFFIAAWMFAARGERWLPKVLMMALALLGMLAHGRWCKFKDVKRDLKWSFYVILTVLGLGAVTAYLLGLLGFGRLSLSIDLNDLLWYLVAVAFAEELFFRGYVQPLLNQHFTKEYKSFIGFKSTWHQGTLITSIFYFGLPHLLTSINPFLSKYTLDVQTAMIAASACFLGLVFGIIRESTGNIIVSTAVHFSVVYGTFSLFPSIAKGMAAFIAPAISLFLFFLVIFQKLLDDYKEL